MTPVEGGSGAAAAPLSLALRSCVELPEPTGRRWSVGTCRAASAEPSLVEDQPGSGSLSARSWPTVCGSALGDPLRESERSPAWCSGARAKVLGNASSNENVSSEGGFSSSLRSEQEPLTASARAATGEALTDAPGGRPPTASAVGSRLPSGKGPSFASGPPFLGLVDAVAVAIAETSGAIAPVVREPREEERPDSGLGEGAVQQRQEEAGREGGCAAAGHMEEGRCLDARSRWNRVNILSRFVGGRKEVGPEELRRVPSTLSFASTRLSTLLSYGVAALPELPDITDSKDRMTFTAFTGLLGCLFIFTSGTNVMLMVTVNEVESSKGDFREGISFPFLVWLVQPAWLLFQAVVFLDALGSYLVLASGRFCSGLDRHFRCGCLPLEPGERKAADFIGSSNLRRPWLWRALDRRLGVELTPRRYLLVLALLLPMNVLVFYRNIGAPAFTSSRLVGLDVAPLLRAPWPQVGVVRVGSLALDMQTWILTSEDGSIDPPLNITSRECYHPDDPEYAMFTRLHGVDAGKQAHCESVLGTMLVRRMGWDDDMWEETFGFVVRLFGAFAGVIADQMLGREGCGFLEDMTDIFDMYLLSFADVVQMHEGRPMLGSRSPIAISFHDCVPIVLVTAYVAMILRALAIFGYMPIARMLVRLGHPAGKAGDSGLARLQLSVGAASSLLLIELPFLSLRGMALFNYKVPVSVLAVKNLLHAYHELRILKIFDGFAEAESLVDGEGAARLWWCCRRHQRKRELEEQYSSIVSGAL